MFLKIVYELHSRSDAENRLLKWIDKTEKLQLKEFNTVRILLNTTMSKFLTFLSTETPMQSKSNSLELI